LVLTAASDPGVNAFMPAAAPPTPPTNTQPPPSLQPQGDGNTLATQPLPGDRDGLYGGTVNTPEVDRETIINYFGAHPAQAGAFVDALNQSPPVCWSQGCWLTLDRLPDYLRELTPAVLRLDTRVTNHGFDGTHPTAMQSVLQTGTAVLVDARGLPRVRGLSGSPLTTPVALKGEPKLLGAPWPGYRAGALAEVEATKAAIGNFVLVDILTGQPFNRPAGTTGTNDTPHPQPVAPPQPDSGTPSTSTPPTTPQDPLSGIDGNYLWDYKVDPKYGCGINGPPFTVTVTHQGNTVTMAFPHGTYTGTLNANGSFVLNTGTGSTDKGAFATEGGRSVVRDGEHRDLSSCVGRFTATKQ
jgi:hypothetical protein